MTICNQLDVMFFDTHSASRVGECQDVLQRGYKHKTSLSNLCHAACTEPNLPQYQATSLPYPYFYLWICILLIPTPSPDYLQFTKTLDPTPNERH
jgi:hypothetical protein